jgi:hypothetical protein
MIIDLSPTEPARIGWRLPRGVHVREQFYFHDLTGARADMTNTNPQLVLRPRSRGGVLGYDLDMSGYPAGGYGTVDIEGGVINDLNGYLVEMYSRDAAGSPTGLLAKGEVAVSGGAYQYEGPYGPLTLPVVAGPPGPIGPVGVQGEQGIRGGTWTTGASAPSTPGQVEGDMYLQDDGSVFRWSGTTWVRGAF